MKNADFPWLVPFTSTVFFTCLAWILLDPSPKISWLFLGILIGAVIEINMLFIKRKATSTIGILALLFFYILAIALKRLLPSLLGFATGLFIPFILFLAFYQVLQKKRLTWAEIRELYYVDSVG